MKKGRKEEEKKSREKKYSRLFLWIRLYANTHYAECLLVNS